jgi:hypothetical protein
MSNLLSLGYRESSIGKKPVETKGVRFFPRTGYVVRVCIPYSTIPAGKFRFRSSRYK